MSIDTREAALSAHTSGHVAGPHANEMISPMEKMATGPQEGDVALLDIRPSTKRKEIITSAADGHDPFAAGIDWPVIAWFGIMHVMALAAPFYFSWQGFALFFVMQFITGSIGVCMGYHRLLTHGSFTCSKRMRWFFALMGQLSGEGTVLQWIATHRKHHAYSDHDEDPHSPRHGGLWSHLTWMCPQYGRKYFDDLISRFAPDLLKDKGMLFLHKMFLPIHFVTGALMFGAGYWLGGSYMAMSFLIWGMFVRLVYVLHITWFVNSATHMWGYRNYKTTDDSRNLWWVGVLAFGEGWHNNHHAYQRMAKHGHRWWEFDVTYMQIRVLEKLGLIWNVVHDVPNRKLHGTVDHA